MEELFCRTTECNLHDFKINAGGVCKYIDFMWLQQQMIPVQPEVTERVVEIEKPVYIQSEKEVYTYSNKTKPAEVEQGGYRWK